MKSKRYRIRPWFAVGVLLLLCRTSAEANEVWFVDTRPAQVTEDGRIEQLGIERLAEETDGAARWLPSDLGEFLKNADPDIPTVVMIHGNLMSRQEAKQYGLKFHRLTRDAGKHRLVVWSWPSSKQGRCIRADARIKALRADSQGITLAAFLKELGQAQPGGKTAILGFSYGAKVTCRALDRLGRDPEFRGNETEAGLRIRTILLAAAMDCPSLSPGRCYGNALSATDEMLVHVNPEDKTLRFYPMLWKLCGPQAAGKEGLTLSGVSLENRRKVKSVNVHRILGEAHGFMPSLRGLLACQNDFRHYALFE